MTFHPERYIGLGVFLLVLSVAAPPAADWLRTNYRLPPGYGAEGDRRRADRIPATAAAVRWRGTHLPDTVQTTAEERSAGAEASWVKETVEDGAWVYELHVLKGGNWSVTCIASNGNVIPQDARGPAPGSVAGAGG